MGLYRVQVHVRAHLHNAPCTHIVQLQIRVVRLYAIVQYGDHNSLSCVSYLPCFLNIHVVAALCPFLFGYRPSRSISLLAERLAK